MTQCSTGAPRIGTAGWSVPSGAAEGFSKAGSQLERYASRLCCAEINSSFYRPHRPQTYARWAASVPAGFKFAVKAPRAITHESRLRDAQAPLADFIGQIQSLGDALGPMLIQLPPSLRFEAGLVEGFLRGLREGFGGDVVLEPRHLTWFDVEPEALLSEHRVARVAADPARCPAAATPGGWTGLRYWRLHGSPRMYYSPYEEERLIGLSQSLASGDWCVFDNTASGAALVDALALISLVKRRA
jgi:uncharacterized protein YecE (DUF72 family)